MARSPLTSIEQDLIDDGGSVLWSFIKGEQLEFPITLNFLADATFQANYTFEAVVVEGFNDGAGTKPVTIATNPVKTVLTVRSPQNRGGWAAATTYSKEDIVLYNSIYYKALASITGNVGNQAPNLATNLWQVTVLNKIYVQFPLTLASTWAVQPTVGAPVYGFFELRVTEPTDSIITRTWKPVRGMVEILFSPTDIVP